MLSIINHPIYFKTVEEAFVFANPQLHKLLLPELKPAARVTSKSLLELVKKFQNDKVNNKSADILKEITDKILSYIKKGAVGDVLLRQELKKNNSKLMEQLKTAGIEI